MIELRGIEASRAAGVRPHPSAEFLLFPDENIEIKPGDEILVLIGRHADSRHEEYGIPLRVTDKAEADENEVVVQYGEKLFVAQKIPEFI